MIISGLELLPIIVIILITLFVEIIFWAIYKNEPKVDKGFVFPYYKLTYRRRMVRTFWSAAVVIVCLIIIYQSAVWSTNVYIIFSSICIIGVAGQFFYNFYKWKKYEQHAFKEEM